MPHRQTVQMEQEVWPTVHVVGIGDDGAQCLRADVLALINGADLLCGGERHLAFFAHHAAERFVIKRNIEAFCALLEHAAGRRRVVVLASGDPCLFGIGPLVAERLGQQRVTIHPQPSSVSLAFARLGLAWQDAVVLSAHGRSLAGILDRALGAPRFAVLTDPHNTPAIVAQALLAAGMEDASAHVFEHLGGERERRVDGTLSSLVDQQFANLNVLIVDRLLSQSQLLAARAFGLHEDTYASERGQITKAEVRAVALSKLEPWRAQVAWDVGAGSGSLALELAGLMPSGTVYAVEQDQTQLAVLRQNLSRYPRPNLRVVAGAAPHALTALPAPDAVFVGGSSGTLAATLAAAAGALTPGGRLVANFAQLESLGVWQRYAAALRWPQGLVQISIARGTPLATGTRLAPLSPVFVTLLQRPEAVAGTTANQRPTARPEERG